MEVTDIEIRMEEQPRTYETLCRPREKGQEASLLVGSDKLAEMETGWRHVEDIAREFGIGTFVSNDTCEKALNIVIKLQTVNGRAVAKISDTPGKAMCRDQEYLTYLKSSVAFRLNREKE